MRSFVSAHRTLRFASLAALFNHNSAMTNQRRLQSTTAATPAAAAVAAPTHDQVWALWNEGNLFSLSVAQLDGFLTANRVTSDVSKKKAMMVRQVEELLQARDNAAKGLPANAHQQQQQQQNSTRGAWAAAQPQPVSPPETLLDLTQTGFYDSPHAMAPKAFQLLVTDSTPEVVVSRVNTTSFPGFPANSECYSLTPADSKLALRTRFSKAFQWCIMNMTNLRLEGEFQADFGKLLIHENVMHKNRAVASSYALQQRLQVASRAVGNVSSGSDAAASNWLSAVSDLSIPAMEAMIADEMFSPVGRSQVVYEARIRRAKDVLLAEMNSKGQVTGVNHEWHDCQTCYATNAQNIDIRMLLRTRQAPRRQDVELYSSTPVLKLSADDVTDALAPEHGQVIYVSENEVRRWEKRNTLSGARLSIVETKRQPLIVLRDEEEDPRVEYQLLATIPTPANGAEKVDLRQLSLELYDVALLMGETLSDGFSKSFLN